MSLKISDKLENILLEEWIEYFNKYAPDSRNMITKLAIDPSKKSFFITFFYGDFKILPFDFDVYNSYIKQMELQGMLSLDIIKKYIHDVTNSILLLKSLLYSVLETFFGATLLELQTTSQKLVLGAIAFVFTASCIFNGHNKLLKEKAEELEKYKQKYILYMKHSEDFKIQLKDPDTQEKHEFCFCNIGHLNYFATETELWNYICIVRKCKDDFITYYTELFFSENTLSEEKMHNALNVPFALDGRTTIAEPFFMDENLRDLYEISVEEEIQEIKEKVLEFGAHME